MSKNKILIFKTKDNKEPLIDWLNSIKDIVVKARIKSRLERIDKGNLEDIKNLKGGLYELRLFFGPGYRIYYGKIKRTIILLLCGGDKNSQEKDIKKARKYFNEYKKL